MRPQPPNIPGTPQDPDPSLRFEISLYHGGRVCPVPPPPLQVPRRPPKSNHPTSAIPGGTLRTSYRVQRPLLREVGWSHFWGEQQGFPGIRGVRGISGGRHPSIATVI